jgi:hypothetical protein
MTWEFHDPPRFIRLLVSWMYSTSARTKLVFRSIAMKARKFDFLLRLIRFLVTSGNKFRVSLGTTIFEVFIPSNQILAVHRRVNSSSPQLFECIVSIGIKIFELRPMERLVSSWTGVDRLISTTWNFHLPHIHQFFGNACSYNKSIQHPPQVVSMQTFLMQCKH